ncbi:MAG: hypothetical protein IKR05_06255 [Prevotella sp.]|nr:hypothetical protein [Prevotella sp.]
MNSEFEDMRKQMEILKEKLQNQDIVNEKILRRSMRKSMLSINRRYMIVCILCIFMMPYSYWAFVKLNGMSIYMFLATCLLMLVVLAYTLYNGRHLGSRLMGKDLVEVREKVANAKKLDQDWLKIGIPLAVLWLAYFSYEQYKVMGMDNWVLPVGLCVIAGCVGAAIGLKVHFRIQDEYSEIIDEIDDFKGQ